MKKFTGLFLVALITFSLSCFSDSENPSNTGNEVDDPKTMNRIIPPVDTMQVDFSLVENMYKGDVKCEQPENNLSPGEVLCIGQAIALVTWSYYICITPLSIPIAIYRVLQDQTPTEATDTHVEWSYTHTCFGVEHTVAVIADKNGGEYDWDWSVIIDDFLWITGGSMEDNTAGEWQYHDPNLPAGANNTILVEWTRGDDFDGSVKFTNNTDDPVWADMKGDYILYKREGNEIEVNFYDIHYEFDGSNDILSIKVYWNIADRTGGIIQNPDNEVSHGECQWDPNE